MAANLDPLPHVKVKVDSKNYKALVLKILASVKPCWHQEDIEITRISQGYGNTLLNCSEKSPGHIVIVRVFGETQGLDRNTEIEVLRIMSHNRVCAKIHCRFDNGVVYDFIPGRTLTRKEMNDDLMRKIAQHIHKMREIDMKQYMQTSTRPDIREVLDIRVKYIKDGNFDDIFSGERYKSMMPSMLELNDICSRAIEYYSYLCDNYPVVFSHCDLHVHNIIYQKETGCMSFVDWELSGMAPEIYEISVFIDRDPELGDDFHDPASRRQCLQCYLSTHPVYGTQPITEQVLQQWYKDSLKASCVSALLGVLYGIVIIKAPIKQVDTIGFAAFHYNLYKKFYAELAQLEKKIRYEKV